MNIKIKAVIIISLFLICSFSYQSNVFSESRTDHVSDIDEISGEHDGNDHESVDSEHEHVNVDQVNHGLETEADPHEHELHDDEYVGHSEIENEHDEDEHDHAGESVSDIDDYDHDEAGHVEGAVKLTDNQKREINLKLEKAGPGNLYNELSLMGETKLNQDLVAHVIPRMPGIVKEIKVSLGDEVKEGQILAIFDSVELAEAKADYLEKLRQFEIAEKDFQRKKYLHEEKIASNASRIEKEAEYLNAGTALKVAKSMLILSGLTNEEIHKLPEATDIMYGKYVLRAPMSGTIIEKHITNGEKLDDEAEIFTVADLSKLWVDLSVPARDIYQVRQGSDVVIEASNGMKAVGTISLIGPTVNVDTRTAMARVIMDNKGRNWKPGLFITGHIRITAENLPIVVPGEAVQGMEGEDVIFIQDGDIYEPVAVVTGRRDRKRVEIIAGLEHGTTYVTNGAFELKAIMITSGMDSHAGHGH